MPSFVFLSPPRFLAVRVLDIAQEGVRESAAAYGTTAVILQGLAHDMMLDTRWEEAAKALEGWLKEAIVGRSEAEETPAQVW